MSELGCTDLGEMDIQVQEGSTPAAVKPYRTSREERAVIAKHVQIWREHGIVEDTTSSYAAPVLLVMKSSGESRLVIDYRRLNAQTVKQIYPLPKIDDILEGFAGCKLFTVLDLAHGYLQIPLTPESRSRTAFITPDEVGQFTRMTFGLTNAPFHFAKIMDRAMGGLKGTVVFNYFDDYFIPATDWNDMRVRVDKVMTALERAKLTLRPGKCVFASTVIDFLGYKLSSDGLKPGDHKMGAIDGYPTPVNVHEVRRFIGLASYFRRFIPKFAIIAKPITDLTKGGNPFRWGTVQQTAFEEIKQCITRQPTLQLFDAARTTEVHTDASAVGIAGMLLQRGDDNCLHPVYCVSKKNSSAEMNYHSSRLELMAIVWTLDRLRSWLIGIHVTVVTDCQALIYMNGQRTRNPQITRWFDLIQDFDIEVRHRAGEKMVHVDALSRAPAGEDNNAFDEIINRRLEVLTSTIQNPAEQVVQAMQYSDQEVRRIMAELKVRNTENRTARWASPTSKDEWKRTFPHKEDPSANVADHVTSTTFNKCQVEPGRLDGSGWTNVINIRNFIRYYYYYYVVSYY